MYHWGLELPTGALSVSPTVRTLLPQEKISPSHETCRPIILDSVLQRPRACARSTASRFSWKPCVICWKHYYLGIHVGNWKTWLTIQPRMLAVILSRPRLSFGDPDVLESKKSSAGYLAALALIGFITPGGRYPATVTSTQRKLRLPSFSHLAPALRSSNNPDRPLRFSCHDNLVFHPALPCLLLKRRKREPQLYRSSLLIPLCASPSPLPLLL